MSKIRKELNLKIVITGDDEYEVINELKSIKENVEYLLREKKFKDQRKKNEVDKTFKKHYN